jgi:signal transduction histidine kinase
MTLHPIRTLHTRLAIASCWAGALVAAVGAAVLCGWIFDVESLKTIYGPITMKANAAVAILLSGTSLWSLGLYESRRWTALGLASAIGAAAIGLLTLSQHLTGWNLGIDELLFSEVPGAAATASPGRMGAHASISFICAAVALGLLHTGRGTGLAQALSFTASAWALAAVAGYMYGAAELYGIAFWTGIALNTAIALLTLHVGILTARANRGPMAIFANERTAGLLLRRLTPWVIAIPITLGYVFVLFRRAELVDRGLGIALLTMALIVVLLAMLWHTAAIIDVTDRERARAQHAADGANRLKGQFIAILSHELRTPLNVMLGRLRLLEEPGDDATRARAATIVARNGRLLARLVEDLLDLSRATAGQFEIARESVDLNDVVRSVVDASLADAAEKHVDLTASLDPTVGRLSLDQQRIQQVVSNLVVNALKFTPAGGRVAARTARNADNAVITVTDTGIGFDNDFVERLFQPFQQADSSTRREHGGLGLGLSIARHLIELHGGSIRAKSPGPGQGATFIVTLPCAAPREPSAAVALPPRTEHEGATPL